MIFGKSKCTELCEGTIVRLRSTGDVGMGNSGTCLYVKYVVDGTEYQLKEMLHVKSKTIKWGSIPIGQEKIPVLGDVSIGAKVAVLYNPVKPKRAYLRDNKGIQTS